MDYNKYLQLDELELSPTSLYRGRVIANDDPDRRGRVRIRVNAIHGLPQAPSFLRDEELPWALPGGWIGSGHNMGPFIVPTVGTVVWIMFEGGNTSTPVYFGGVPSLKGSRPKSLNSGNEEVLGGEILTDTDDTPVEVIDPASEGLILKTIKGTQVGYSDKDNEEEFWIVGPSGQYIKLTASELVHERRNSDDPMTPGKIEMSSYPGTEAVLDEAFTLKLHFRVEGIKDE